MQCLYGCEHLTTKTLSLEEAVQLSETNGANRWRGTSMKVLHRSLPNDLAWNDRIQ